jgi:DNA-directed RNA polymerase specialized sigma24 family protein
MEPDDDFRRFFDEQFGRLRHLGFLLTGSWAEGEELAQDALVRTLGAWPRIKDRGQAGGYARTVLVNRHRSLLRRALVRARHLHAAGPERPVPPPGGEDRLVVWEALGRLPEAQRTVLVLRFWEDLSEAEVCRLVRLRQDLSRRSAGGAQAFEVAR